MRKRRREYPLLRGVVATAALVILWATFALAGVPSKPYTFSPNTVIQSAQVNADFDTLYSAFVQIDHTNVGSAGIYASQIIPDSQAHASFGGTNVYTFPTSLILNGAASVSITAGSNGTDGNAIFGLTSGGSNHPFIGCTGTAQGCTLSFYVNGTGSGPSLTLDSTGTFSFLKATGMTASTCARWDGSATLASASVDCLTNVTAGTNISVTPNGTAPTVSVVAAPSFTNLTDTGVAASACVGTSAGQALVANTNCVKNLTASTNIVVGTGSAPTIATVSNPSFTSVNVSGLGTNSCLGSDASRNLSNTACVTNITTSGNGINVTPVGTNFQLSLARSLIPVTDVNGSTQSNYHLVVFTGNYSASPTTCGPFTTVYCASITLSGGAAFSSASSWDCGGGVGAYGNGISQNNPTTGYWSTAQSSNVGIATNDGTHFYVSNGVQAPVASGFRFTCGGN